MTPPSDLSKSLQAMSQPETRAGFSRDDAAMTPYRVRASDGVMLQAYHSGDRQLPALVLIHGYPDNHRIWGRLLPYLQRHFQIVCYDVRGAGASGAATNTAGYALSQLADDLAQLTQAILGDQPFHLAGHDWGSIQGWQAVMTTPLCERILSFTSMSGPSLDMASQWMRQQLRLLTPRSVLRQLGRSWYIGFFHLPGLPAWYWRQQGKRGWDRFLRRNMGLQRQHLDPQNHTQLADALEGMKLYRANMLSRTRHPALQTVSVPVQLIIFQRDAFIHPDIFENVEDHVTDLTIRRIDDNHWAIVTQAARLATLITAFAAQHEAGRRHVTAGA